MAHNQLGDTDSILMDDVVRDAGATLIDHRFSLPSPVEFAIAQYADSLERLHSAGLDVPDDQYTRGFVAGLRAAAKVAANVSGT